MGMRLHPREKIVREARISLDDKIGDWDREEGTRDLTEGEYISIVASIFGGHLSTFAKYMIREERHGDQDRPGGLA